MRDNQQHQSDPIECVVSLWQQRGNEWVNVDNDKDSIRPWREDAVKGVPSEMRCNIGSLTFTSHSVNQSVIDFVKQSKQDAALTYDKIAERFKFSHEVKTQPVNQTKKRGVKA